MWETGLNLKQTKFGKPSKVYGSIAEVDAEFRYIAKVAMQRTLDHFAEVLLEFINSNVYGAYHPKFYNRTYSLKHSIKTYMYNSFGKGIGGGIKFDDTYYYAHTDLENFQHGNPEYGFVEFNSFLEIMNDSSKLKRNIFHFPIIQREPFLDGFKHYVKANFNDVYKNAFNDILGRKYNQISETIYYYLIKATRPKATAKTNVSNKGLSSSTSNIPSLNTGTIADTTKKNVIGKISVYSEGGKLISESTFNTK